MAPDRLEEAWQAGRSAWPTLPLGLEAYRAHARHVPDADHAADHFLTVACLAGDEGAARILRERHRGDVEAVASRLGLREHRDEIVQRVLHRLLVGGARQPALAGYEGRGPLRSWLRVVAVRQAYDVARERQKRARHEVAPGDDALLDHAVADGDPELTYLKEMYGDHVKAAFEEAFAALPREERQWLRFAYLEGLNLDRLAVVFRTSRATAGRRRKRALQRVMQDTRARLATSLGVPDGELDSVMNLVRSRLHLSLSRLLDSSS